MPKTGTAALRKTPQHIEELVKNIKRKPSFLEDNYGCA
jgi:hypothetical protein